MTLGLLRTCLMRADINHQVERPSEPGHNSLIGHGNGQSYPPHTAFGRAESRSPRWRSNRAHV
jgi:hypothetical protein